MKSSTAGRPATIARTPYTVSVTAALDTMMACTTLIHTMAKNAKRLLSGSSLTNARSWETNGCGARLAAPDGAPRPALRSSWSSGTSQANTNSTTSMLTARLVDMLCMSPSAGCIDPGAGPVPASAASSCTSDPGSVPGADALALRLRKRPGAAPIVLTTSRPCAAAASVAKSEAGSRDGDASGPGISIASKSGSSPSPRLAPAAGSSASGSESGGADIASRTPCSAAATSIVAAPLPVSHSIRNAACMSRTMWKFW
mmetsp:Transcript_12624/g.36855  ORF Transcript_12624/g.36855 Transcript_12624/m.36855 type:complete len:257 (+) Transcript_12624:351-1121(+)